jgi:DNA-binding transcriptional LysR family regulator
MFLMRYTHIRRSDLNLLVSFQALLEERSVTRAARQMFLSQPAMSRVFDRLQHLFRDELLVRTVNGYEPTHRAAHIYAELERLLPRVEELLRGAQFDPAEATDSFRIAATDHAAIVLLPAIMEELARTAPAIQVEVSSWGDEVFRNLNANTLDLALWVNQAPQPLRTEPLFHDDFVCLFRAGHPAAKRPLTLKRYLEQKHVAVSVAGRQQGVVERNLDRYGVRRNVQLNVPYYGAVGSIVERTDMVATLSKRLAKRLTAISNTVLVPAPKEFQKFTYIQVWHPRHESDPAHAWFRGVVRKASSLS